MPAPLAIPALIAFLTGAGGGAYLGPGLAVAVKGEAVVAGVYADLPAICKATDPLIDALGDAYPSSAAFVRVVAVADAVCKASSAPNTPIGQAELVISAIFALEAANAKLAKAKPAAAAPIVAVANAGPMSRR